mmetsp:Transcript_96874/g.168130  ORF Transcript_96874/g.168130 Transcript_96874/m.168130 type:complete len:210 (+) Transcript_96874:340-969(+)
MELARRAIEAAPSSGKPLYLLSKLVWLISWRILKICGIESPSAAYTSCKSEAATGAVPCFATDTIRPRRSGDRLSSIGNFQYPPSHCIRNTSGPTGNRCENGRMVPQSSVIMSPEVFIFKGTMFSLPSGDLYMIPVSVKKKPSGNPSGASLCSEKPTRIVPSSSRHSSSLSRSVGRDVQKSSTRKAGYSFDHQWRTCSSKQPQVTTRAQ